ncbi:MAG: ribonuclease HIII, partial [Verrucomicrobiae bacterium]|nr:ribonuclease HIII [Verrucomicrobiae bacterium]
MEKGRGIELQQRTKAESDVAVAAASILAREAFIDWLRDARDNLGFELPKGASAQVKEVGREIAQRHGAEGLGKVAKMHFKTANEILAKISQD